MNAAHSTPASSPRLSRRQALLGFSAVIAANLVAPLKFIDAEDAQSQPSVAPPDRLVLDMVHNNPGEAPIASEFCDPKRLADWNFSGQVLDSLIEGISTFDTLAPGLLPRGSKDRDWADDQTNLLAKQINAAHAAGIHCYAWMQVLVLPKRVVAAFKNEICDPHGRIDLSLPRTQQLFRAQLRELFERLSDLDGLVIRTGEIYLQDLPYHTATGTDNRSLIQGSTAILDGVRSHQTILGILRSEICEKLGRTVIYRTWDFGNNFHVNPRYYLQVANAIQPHEKLYLSMKHQAGDFHRLTPFNPTINIGHHRQVIEVQCQLEGYGKGAHPYYIGQGVIDGWEEYAWLMKPGQAKGLRDIAASPIFGGVSLWARGGGWHGPYITREFWCGLNAYVVAKFAEDPARHEDEIFAAFAQMIGLKGDDIERFRQLNLLSAKAVLRGQLTTLGAKISVWWARDDTLSLPDLSDFVAKGLVEKAMAEKAEAVAMWRQIEALASAIHFPDRKTKDFVTVSATYGRIKYAVVEQGWKIIFLGSAGDTSGIYDKEKLSTAIRTYDKLWQEWRALKSANPSCSTLPFDRLKGGKPGLGNVVDKYRSVVITTAEPKA